MGRTPEGKQITKQITVVSRIAEKTKERVEVEFEDGWVQGMEDRGKVGCSPGSRQRQQETRCKHCHSL